MKCAACMLNVVACVLVPGCSSSPTLEDSSRDSKILRVGMRLSQAETMLLGHEGKDITATVAITRGGDSDTIAESRWYLLSDGTCLHLYATRPRADTTVVSTVREIVLGAHGQGYGDKVQWMQQPQTSVQSLPLNVRQ